jgi:hypothetical protein
MSGLAYGLVGDGVKQAFLEAETAVNTYAPPDLIKHSPGVAKVWVQWEQDGSHGIPSGGSYGGGSVVDGTSAGETDHTYGTVFSGAGIQAFVFGADHGPRVVNIQTGTDLAATVTTLTKRSSDDTAQDSNFNCMTVFGDQ